MDQNDYTEVEEEIEVLCSSSMPFYPSVSSPKAPVSLAPECINENTEPVLSSSDSESLDDSSASDLEIADVGDFEQAMISVDKAFYEEEMGLSLEPLRTKNEVINIAITKPTLEIKPDMHLTEVGSVLHVVEDQIVIKVNVTGEYKILDIGTILVLEDKEVLGEIFETIGPVAHPMYIVRFNDPSEINKEKVIRDAKVFRVDELSKFVFTRDISEHKGCDASNAFDEEVNEEEIEFSDDEKEQQFNETQRNKMRETHDSASTTPISDYTECDMTQGVNSIPTSNNTRGGNKRRGKRRNNKSNRRGAKNGTNGDNAGTSSTNNTSGSHGRSVINRGNRRNRGTRHYPYHPQNDQGQGKVDDFDYNILPRPKVSSPGSPETHQLNYPGVTGVGHFPSQQLVNETPLIPGSSDPSNLPGSDN